MYNCYGAANHWRTSFPRWSTFLHSCSFIPYGKCVDPSIQLICHTSIYGRLWIKHYSVLDKMNLNCRVTETTFRSSYFCPWSWSYRDQKNSLQHPVPCPNYVQVVLTILPPQDTGGVQKKLEVGTYDDKGIKISLMFSASLPLQNPLDFGADSQDIRKGWF